MHQSSFDKMTAFRRDYLEPRRAEPLVILDLGSQDINGCYRPLFALPPWKYVGVDLAAGELGAAGRSAPARASTPSGEAGPVSPKPPVVGSRA